MFWAPYWTRLPRNRRQGRNRFDHQFCQWPSATKAIFLLPYFNHESPRITRMNPDSYHFPMIIGTYSRRQGRAACSRSIGAARSSSPGSAAAPPNPLHWLSLGIGIICHTVPARRRPARCWACQNTDLIMEFTPEMRSSTCSFVGLPFLCCEHRLRKSPSR